jgi:hypothetical protein
MFSSSVYNEPSTFECAYPNIKEPIAPSKLGYHSNNKYDGFPPLMCDGRAVTASYQPAGVLNEYLVQEIDVTSIWQYRQYLTKNGKDVMKYNYVQAANDAGYIKRYADLGNSTNSTPYVYSSMVDSTQPVGYQTSDLKELYLSREQLQSRMVAPEITQEALYKMKASS